jgi:hypothetical protein
MRFGRNVERDIGVEILQERQLFGRHGKGKIGGE